MSHQFSVDTTFQQTTIPLPFSNFNPNDEFDSVLSSSDSDSIDQSTFHPTSIIEGLTITQIIPSTNASKLTTPSSTVPPISPQQQLQQQQQQQQQQRQPKILPFTELLGDLQYELSPSILSRLPKDTSKESWDEWIAERKRRYPRIQRNIQTTTLNATIQSNKPIISSTTAMSLIDDYSDDDNDDDGPPLESTLQRAHIIEPPIHSTNTITNNKNNNNDNNNTNNYNLSSELIFNIDPIHTPEMNSELINSELLQTRYDEYLYHLGIHPSIIYLLQSYPPIKLPIFPIMIHDKDKDKFNNTHNKNKKFQHKSSSLHHTPNTTNNNNSNQQSTSYPQRRIINILQCTSPDNPFISLCLTLHAQYGIQSSQLYQPGRQSQQQSQQSSATKFIYQQLTDRQTSSTLPIESILSQCHSRITSAGQKSDGNNHNHDKGKKKNFHKNGFKSCSRNQSNSSPITCNYVDLYKKLISQDLAQEFKLILIAFRTILDHQFFQE